MKSTSLLKNLPKRIYRSAVSRTQTAIWGPQATENPPYSYRELCTKLNSLPDIRIKPFADFQFHKTNRRPFDLHSKDTDGFKNIFIRHDVDHDPFFALRMAKVEAEEGIRSTYFVLTSDARWIVKRWNKQRTQFLRALIEIQELGHEVGLHYDLFGDYFAKGKDVVGNVKEILGIFRDAGLDIRGCASHGSSSIANLVQKELGGPIPKQFVNYNVWEETCKTPTILRLNGKELSTPVLKLSDVGLDYEAYFVIRHGYCADVNGRFWQITDPVKGVRNTAIGEIFVMNVHPIWWKKHLG